jgi:site-specific DNA-methyltransferase (adenine-specific)
MNVITETQTIVETKIELYNMDCMEYMATLEDNAFDLAIVDPPYGGNDAIGLTDNADCKKQATKRTNYKVFENVAPSKEYFDELKRVSKHQIIWGVNFYNNYDLSGGRLVWDKKGTAFGRAEMAYLSMTKSVNICEIVWNGMLQHDMKNKETRIHPTQKPKKLYEWLLKNYATEGDKILDTHLGSGSSAIASYNYKFDFVGLEIDKEYFDNAVKRFNNYKSQLTMF